MMALLIKAKKSPEGTLKKYPSGLIYKKQGEKWVYVAKVGTKKADDLIEEAKKKGVPVLEPTGKKITQSTTPSQSQPQQTDASKQTQASTPSTTADAPVKTVAADSGKWKSKKITDLKKEDFEGAIETLYDKLDKSTLNTLATKYGINIDISTFGKLIDTFESKKAVKELLSELSKNYTSSKFNEKVEAETYAQFRHLFYAYWALKETFSDSHPLITISNIYSRREGVIISFTGMNWQILPKVSMDWGDLDTFIAANKGTQAGKQAQKMKQTSDYKIWQSQGGDPVVSKLIKDFQDDIGLPLEAANMSARRGTLLKPAYLKILHETFKGLRNEIDMRKYNPPDGQKMKVTVAGASRRFAGFYTEHNHTINISPSYTGTIVHEMGHYFWYRSPEMQKEFTEWVKKSGLNDKIVEALYGIPKVGSDELKKHIDAMFDNLLRTHDESFNKFTVVKDAMQKAQVGGDIRTVQSATQYVDHLMWGIYRDKMIKEDGKVPAEAKYGSPFVSQGIIDSDDARLKLLATKIHADYPQLVSGTDELQTLNCLKIYKNVMREIDPATRTRLVDGELHYAITNSSKTRLQERKLEPVEYFRKKRRYWSDYNEIFARSFRTYVAMKGGQKEGDRDPSVPGTVYNPKGYRINPLGWGFPEVDPSYDMVKSLEPILKKYLGGSLLKSIVKSVILLEKAKFDDNKIKKQIIKWLKKHPKPEDEAVHTFADSIGVNKHHVEEMIYQLLGEKLKTKKSIHMFIFSLLKAGAGTHAERPGHKYIKRWWENNQWNYLYPEDVAKEHAKAPEEEGTPRQPKQEESTEKKTAEAEPSKEEQHEVRAEPGITSQFGDRDRELAKTEPEKTPLDASQPYKEWGIQLVRPEQTKRARANYISEDIGRNLRPYQADFVNLALEQFQMGQKGVLNMDGTGAGKTRQEIALASEYLDKNPNAKVLITTDSDRIIDNAFANDGKAMGVSFTKIKKGDEMTSGGAGIYIAPYTRLEKMKKDFEDVDLIILDESHNLKNYGRAKTENGTAIIKEAAHVAYFTATPVDKAEHIHYLCEGLGLNFFDTMNFLGYTLEHKSYGDVWGTNLSKKVVADRINSIFEGLTKSGVAVKREVSLANLDMSIKNVSLTVEDEKRFQSALTDFEERLSRATGLKYGLVKATGLMALRRLVEEMKIEPTVNMIKQKLEEGKQVVLFATRVNESEIGGDTNQYSEGTLKAVEELLKKEGIEFSSVFASNKEAEKAIDNFQSGKVKVLLTTPESGGTGLNLDDRTGKAPRSAIIMTPPFSAMPFIQMVGRINRLTTKSRAEATMLTVGSGAAQAIDDWNKNIIANKLTTLGASVKGDYAAMDVEDLERVQYMNEQEAREYMAQKRKDAVIGVGPTAQFDPFAHKLAVQGTKADVIKKKKKDILAAAPPVTKFDKMTITKTGDKFTVQFNYNSDIVKVLQGLPQKDRTFVKHTRSWIVDPAHLDALKEAGKKYATLSDSEKLAQVTATQGAPSKITVGHFQASRVGNSFRVAFNYDPNLVARVKAIPGRSYDPNTKTWMVPVDQWKELEKMSKEVMKKGTPTVIPIAETSRSDALKALQMLSQVCDGASKQDQMGFSKFDVKVGHDLAHKDRLSDGQFRLAQKILRKYRRQIPDDIMDSIMKGMSMKGTTSPVNKSRKTILAILLKGKEYPEGTIRVWHGKKFKKQGGTWSYLTDGKTKIEHAKDQDSANVREKFSAYSLELKEKYGKTPPHEEMNDDEKKKYEKLKIQVYKFHPDGKMPSSRKVDGSHEMRVALADVSRRTIYIDDLTDEEKPIYNVLVREGLITWNHIAADEYVASLTDVGKKAVATHAAHRKHAQREEERKAMRTRKREGA